MRVLWFVNMPFPAVRRFLGMPPGYRGWWLPDMARRLSEGDGIELGIVWATRAVSEPVSVVDEGIAYYVVPLGRWCSWSQSFGSELDECMRIVSSFSPDLIDVHGTESFYGLLAKRCRVPMVVTLQGLICEIRKRFFGNLKGAQRFNKSIMLGYVMMRNRGKTERKIFNVNRNFLGRTEWDRSVLAQLNPKARYFTCHRIEREIFYRTKWEYSLGHSFTLYATSSGSPLKGVDLLLDAVSQLRSSGYPVFLRLAGGFPADGYGGIIRARLQDPELASAVTLPGQLDGDGVAGELASADLFVVPSLIENSSNSLAEAMLVGTPSVAYAVGGNPSMIPCELHQQCLISQTTSAALGARIQEAMDDYDAFSQMSPVLQRAAHARHDPDENMARLHRAYEAVVSGHPHNS